MIELSMGFLLAFCIIGGGAGIGKILEEQNISPEEFAERVFKSCKFVYLTLILFTLLNMIILQIR